MISRFENVMNEAGADFSIDPWGSVMGLFFDIAEVLNMADVEGDMTPALFEKWQYRPGPFAVPDIEAVAAREEDFSEGEFADDYSYGLVALVWALHSGCITVEDLVYAGNVLDRYSRLLDAAGLSY